MKQRTSKPLDIAPAASGLQPSCRSMSSQDACGLFPSKVKRRAGANERIDRETLAYNLRKQGLKYLEIGNQLGVSHHRARQLYKSAEYQRFKEPEWNDGLSVRTRNCFAVMGITSRYQVMHAYQSGRLRVGRRGPRNYGRKSHKEVAKWLGLPEPIWPKPNHQQENS